MPLQGQAAAGAVGAALQLLLQLLVAALLLHTQSLLVLQGSRKHR
jgi:hypothetical protein